MHIDKQLRTIVEKAVKEHGNVNRLCKTSGVPQSSLAAWLLGTQANISWKAVCTLSEYLGFELASTNSKPKKKTAKRKAVREVAKKRKASK